MYGTPLPGRAQRTYVCISTREGGIAMREPASREVPLMASVGLLLDQAVISVVRHDVASLSPNSSVRRWRNWRRSSRGAAELETAPLGISRQARLQSSSDLERLEILEDTRPMAAGFAWGTLRDQLEAVLSGKSTPEQSAGLRASLVELVNAGRKLTPFHRLKTDPLVGVVNRVCVVIWLAASPPWWRGGYAHGRLIVGGWWTRRRRLGGGGRRLGDRRVSGSAGASRSWGWRTGPRRR